MFAIKILGVMSTRTYSTHLDAELALIRALAYNDCNADDGEIVELS